MCKMECTQRKEKAILDAVFCACDKKTGQISANNSATFELKLVVDAENKAVKHAEKFGTLCKYQFSLMQSKLLLKREKCPLKIKT